MSNIIQEVAAPMCDDDTSTDEEEPEMDWEAEWATFFMTINSWFEHDPVGQQVKKDIWAPALWDHHQCIQKDYVRASSRSRGCNILHCLAAHAGFTDPVTEEAKRPKVMRPFRVVLKVVFQEFLRAYPMHGIRKQVDDPFQALEWLHAEKALAAEKEALPKKRSHEEEPGCSFWGISHGNARAPKRGRGRPPTRRPRKVAFQSSYSELQDEEPEEGTS